MSVVLRPNFSCSSVGRLLAPSGKAMVFAMVRSRAFERNSVGKLDPGFLQDAVVNPPSPNHLYHHGPPPSCDLQIWTYIGPANSRLFPGGILIMLFFFP